MDSVQIIPLPVVDDLGLESLGCDIVIHDDLATVADLLAALDQFAGQYLADCKGCDGCCRERAPLIAADIPALASLLPASSFPAHAVCAAFGELTVSDNGAADICFRRDPKSGACCLLDTKHKCCTAHPCRAFVCRSHFCIPRSDKLSSLREEIVNGGENELTRLLLAEEAQGARPLQDQPLSSQLSAADYPPNPHSGKAHYQDLIIKDIVSTSLWRQLKKEG